MIRVAIVEDEEEVAKELQTLLLKYADEKGLNIQIAIYSNGLIFLNNYAPNFDLVFMDIQMPHMDGLQVAEKLREMDPVTMLIFVTNMAYLAGKGYDVQAFDFIVKPVSYNFLTLKMDRALKALKAKEDRKIIISSEGSKICVPANNIMYVEVMNHRLIYHTESGDYSSYSSLSKVQQILEGNDFALCNNCYLVNLRFVKSVHQLVVTVGDMELKISQPKKKSFMEALNNYIGG